MSRVSSEVRESRLLLGEVNKSTNIQCGFQELLEKLSVLDRSNLPASHCVAQEINMFSLLDTSHITLTIRCDWTQMDFSYSESYSNIF